MEASSPGYLVEALPATNPKEDAMGKLRDQLKTDLRNACYSQNTQEIYLQKATQFARYYSRSPAELGAFEVREFLKYMRDKDVSCSTMKQVRSALRFLYNVTLNKPTEIEWVPVPRQPKRQAVVLSQEQIGNIFNKVICMRYRMPLMIMYSSGLRITEACTLRPEHIDSGRMVIQLIGKGNKERITLLPERLLNELRRYWDLTRITRGSNKWLFTGGTKAGHVATRSTSRALTS